VQADAGRGRWRQSRRAAGLSNTEWLGRLFTDFMLPFEIAAVILTVAVVAAVMLTLRRRGGTKRTRIRRKRGRRSRAHGEDRLRLGGLKPTARREQAVVITLGHYLVLGAVLFCISVAGIFINRKNVIILLMAIELMLLAVNINFVAFSRFLGDAAGQIFVFFILTVAAAEAAIGLAILVTLFRNRAPSTSRNIDTLKG
jgi:NADH-quinone oxidoreductase subunit K